MDFDRDMKKLCVLIAVVIALEVPVFFLWRYFSGDKDQTASSATLLSSEPAQTDPEIMQTELETLSTEPLIPESAGLETLPQTEVTEVTVPEETMEETLPPETIPEETVPPETAAEETAPPGTVPAEIRFDEVPQYYQDDYPEEPYSYTTVANSGGSMTALAMVASYMTDHSYYPDQMADWLAHFLGGDYQRLEYGSDLLQLSWKRGLHVHETLQGVRDGKVAIILMGPKSVFGAERYLVVTGVNEDGTYQAMDTHSTHFGSTWLNSYFEKGFSEGQLVGGYSAGWIYDKSAMPETPFLYEPEPPAKECRYGDLALSEYDIRLIADLICMEAGSEPFEGQQAVAEVVLNRLYSGKFQSSVYNVIHAPGQFPSVDQLHRAKPSYSQFKAVEQALNGPYVLPDDVHFFAKFQENKNLWGKIGTHYFCFSY